MPRRCSPKAETHFSQLKINTSYASSSWVARRNTHPKSINKEERMLTVWTAGGDRHYFQQQLWQNCAFVNFGCPLLYLFPPYQGTFESSMSETYSSHTSFGEIIIWKSLFRNDLLVIQLKILPVTARGLLLSAQKKEPPLMRHRRSNCFKFGFFVPEVSLCVTEEKSECSLFVVTDCVQSRYLLWQANLATQWPALFRMMISISLAWQ